MTETDLRDDVTWVPSDQNGARIRLGMTGRLRRNPDEWFVDLLGARACAAAAAGKTLAVMTAIVARFNAISEGISTASDEHAPIFEKTEDGRALPQAWCMGFLGAMRLRSDAWRPLLDPNHIDHSLPLPNLLHCTDSLGQPMLGPPREGPETEEFVRQAYRAILLVFPATETTGCRSASGSRNVMPDNYGWGAAEPSWVCSRTIR